MLKKYLILTAAVICNIQSMTFNPDVNPNDKKSLIGYLKELKKLNVDIENRNAKATDIINGINLCRNTLDKLQQSGALEKNKKHLKMYEDKLRQTLNKVFPHLTVQ